RDRVPPRGGPLAGDVADQARGAQRGPAAWGPAIDDRLPAAARFLHRPRGPHRVDHVAAVCDRHGVLVPAAATEPLVVGSHDDVAFLDEGFDAGQAVVGPGITTHQEILV